MYIRYVQVYHELIAWTKSGGMSLWITTINLMQTGKAGISYIAVTGSYGYPEGNSTNHGTSRIPPGLYYLLQYSENKTVV